MGKRLYYLVCGVGLSLSLVLGAPLSASAADDRVPALQDIIRKVKRNGAARKRLDPIIVRLAKRHRLDPALLHAVISVESAYNAKAVSYAGAQGLMQLMPATARRFGVENPFDPVANINAGARYLRILLNKFGTLQLALAAYHAGEGRVRRHRNTIPRILQTQKYVVNVIHFFMRYKKHGI